MEKVIKWIDERFPLTQFIKSQATEYQTPRNLNYWWNFGFLAGVVLVLQILTGIFLAMHYKADAKLAFDSIQHIMRDVNYGWLLRYIHATGASAFFIVVYIHMARTLYYGSYRAPRELIWWIGQVLLLLLMATAFMGYLLPWGQMSYWGAQVITNLFGAAPVVGEHVVVLLRGDFSVGDPTLNRFFSLHYLLPFLIAGVVVLHLTALHQVHSSNPAGTRMTPGSTVPFHPYYTIKDMFGLCVFLLVFFYFVFLNPDFFMESENNVPANPIKTPLHIVPEWYFLPFYAILRSIPDKLAGVIAMNVAVVIFVALPFLDRSRIPAGSRYRPIFRLMFYIFVANAFVLAYVGAHPPQGILVTIGAISTVIYFLYFAAMPFISKVEEKWLLRRGRLPQEILDQIEEAPSAEGNGGHS